MKTIKEFFSIEPLFFITATLVLLGYIYLGIKKHNPGLFENKNTYSTTWDWYPDTYRNAFGEVCRKLPVKDEWVVKNRSKNIEGEIYYMYVRPEKEFGINYEYIYKGIPFFNRKYSHKELKDILYSEVGWVNLSDLSFGSCGTRVKEIQMYKRFL